MGIRFACFECKKPLNIKTELAGKRGVCPQCGTRFRIPEHDTDYAIPIVEPDSNQAQASSPAAGSHALNLQDPETPPDVSTPALRSVNVATRSGASIGSEPLMTGMPSLLNDPHATWYVRPPSGGQYGPATGDILRQWISEGRLTPTTLVWRDGWAQWRAANEALVEFGASPKSPAKPLTESIVASTPLSRSAIEARPVDLSGDAQIGGRKSQVTQRRFVIVARSPPSA